MDQAWRDEQSFEITLRPVILGKHPSDYESSPVSPDRITNPRNSDYNGLWLQELTIHAYATVKAGERSIYGHSIGYERPFRVELREAEKMAATLRKIDKAMERLRERDGYPQDLVAFVRHAAQALKVECIVIPRTDHGWSYAENDHEIKTLGSGLDWLSYQVRRFMHPEPEPTTT
jgi:hypothetical protein